MSKTFSWLLSICIVLFLGTFFSFQYLISKVDTQAHKELPEVIHQNDMQMLFPAEAFSNDVMLKLSKDEPLILSLTVGMGVLLIAFAAQLATYTRIALDRYFSNGRDT